MRLRFSDFTFDSGRRLLYRGPEPVRLSPKAFQLLGLLISRRPAAICKAEILENLWPATFVTEGNLASLINEIRQGMGEKGRESRLIRTVHGFGYSFEGGVTEEPEAKVSERHHRLLWGHQEIPLSEGTSVIGRMQEAAICIAHSSVSREHARIIIAEDRVEMEDLGSKNGTFLSDERVTGRVVLSDGDRIRLGRVSMTYRNTYADTTSETETDAAPAPGRVSPFE